MGAAENGNSPDYRPQATGAEPYDFMADATDVWFSLLIIPQWSGSLLGDFKCYQYCHAIFCYRVGRFGFISG